MQIQTNLIQYKEKYIYSGNDMTKYIQRFFAVYTMFCFMFSSTFSFKRDTSNGYTHHPAKIMAFNFENTLRKIKDTSHDFGKSIYDHFNIACKNHSKKNIINEDDIRQYEQLVIMKKYPFLDLHELEMKYFPGSSKNARHSDSFLLDRKVQHEASLNEPEENSINVDIINRGLTGFAIPPYLQKQRLLNSKNVIKPIENPDDSVLIKHSSNSNVLRSLTKDINSYVDKKNLPNP